MARRSMTRKKQRGRASKGTLIGRRLPSGLLARVDRWAASQKDDRAPKRSSALSSWDLRTPNGQECLRRKLRKRRKWQVGKSTAWVTRRQPTNNGNSASGGLSRDRKSSGTFAAIAGQTRNPARLRYDKAAPGPTCYALSRHGRAWPGHPRLCAGTQKTWMPATSAGMTQESS